MIVLILSILSVANCLCPNPTFEQKHVCKNCADSNAAIKFVENVDRLRASKGWAVTFTNGVFAGNPSYSQRGTRCRFNSPLKKYNCRKYGDNWQCPAESKRYYGIHDVNSGHYFYKEDI